MAALALPAALVQAADCPEAPGAGADVRAVFVEGAPTDRLELRNASGGWRITRLAWDLRPSRGRLIFDVTGGGAGVDVFQPLAVVSTGAAAATPAALPAVRDGDEALEIRFRRFDPGQSFALTMDLDDRIGARETLVDGTEIDGATLRVDLARDDGARRSLDLAFDARGRAAACAG